MTIEEHMAKWLKQPGTFVTRAEDQFIVDMRNAAVDGVGYGWMQQVIEWEWQSKGLGSHGPESHGVEIERLQTEVADMQHLLKTAHNSMARQYQRIEALERDLSIEVAAGHDATERAEAAERKRDELRTALQEITTECSTFPLKNGVAFRCESIARAALSGKGES